MRDYRTFSIPLGRWKGLEVRLHLLFVLFAAFTLYLGWRQHDSTSIWIAAGSLGILLISVLLHEIGHWRAAIHLGGTADRLVLGPLGGLAAVHPPLDPRAELTVHLSGPAVNAVLCLLCTPLIIAFDSVAGFVNLLHPLPHESLFLNALEQEAWWRTAIKLTFWINWVLFLVNLLPAFPFDGARVLRSWLSALRPDAPAHWSSQRVALIAKITAAGLLVAAFLCRNIKAEILPIWFVLVLLAILLFFSAKQEEDRRAEPEDEDDLFGYDFSQGYTSLDRTAEKVRSRPGPFVRWLEKRRTQRLQKQQQIEADEERRMDEILQRLHEHGKQSLSDDDRALLNRVSARLRNRRANPI